MRSLLLAGAMIVATGAFAQGGYWVIEPRDHKCEIVTAAIPSSTPR